MRAIKTRLNRLTGILAAAYQARADTAGQFSSDWQAGVMRAVGQIGPYGQAIRQPVDLVQLSWRLAPAALLLMIILTVVIVQTGTAINSQMTALSVTEPTTTYLAYLPF